MNTRKTIPITITDLKDLRISRIERQQTIALIDEILKSVESSPSV